MSYLWGGGLVEHYCDNIEAAGSVLYIVGCEKITGGSAQFVFFGGGDNGFDWCETFIGSGLYFDKDDGAIGIGHNKVYFAGPAGEVAGELFKSLLF